LKVKADFPRLDSMQASDCLSSDGVLAGEVPDFAARPQQQDMAVAVERALAHGEVLIVEAGTGTARADCTVGRSRWNNWS